MRSCLSMHMHTLYPALRSCSSSHLAGSSLPHHFRLELGLGFACGRGFLSNGNALLQRTRDAEREEAQMEGLNVYRSQYPDDDPVQPRAINHNRNRRTATRHEHERNRGPATPDIPPTRHERNRGPVTLDEPPIHPHPNPTSNAHVPTRRKFKPLIPKDLPIPPPPPPRSPYPHAHHAQQYPYLISQLDLDRYIEPLYNNHWHITHSLQHHKLEGDVLVPHTHKTVFLKKTFKFLTFGSALEFFGEVAGLAIRERHEPIIHIEGNDVHILLSTPTAILPKTTTSPTPSILPQDMHTAPGITYADIRLAVLVERLYEEDERFRPVGKLRKWHKQATSGRRKDQPGSIHALHRYLLWVPGVHPAFELLSAKKEEGSSSALGGGSGKGKGLVLGKGSGMWKDGGGGGGGPGFGGPGPGGGGGGGGDVGMDILPDIMRLPQVPQMHRNPPPIKDYDFKAYMEPLYSRGWGVRYQTGFKTLDEAVRLHGGEVGTTTTKKNRSAGDDDGVRLVNVFSFKHFETALNFAMQAGAVGREEPFLTPHTQSLIEIRLESRDVHFCTRTRVFPNPGEAEADAESESDTPSARTNYYISINDIRAAMRVENLFSRRYVNFVRQNPFRVVSMKRYQPGSNEEMMGDFDTMLPSYRRRVRVGLELPKGREEEDGWGSFLPNSSVKGRQA